MCDAAHKEIHTDILPSVPENATLSGKSVNVDVTKLR